MALEEKTAEVNQKLACKQCGAIMTFAPGTNSLKCEYCGTVNEIDTTPQSTVIEEIDLEKFLSESNIADSEKQQISTVQCHSCGACTTLKPNVTSDNCPFCGTALVIKEGSTSSVIKPKYLLPFAIDSKTASASFKKWLGSLWFAPNDLQKYADNDRLNGMYMPYWTYDSSTQSSYTGMRGINYQVEETYTTTENGEEVTRTRVVTQIQWFPVSGSVSQDFDDVLVLASKSLPESYAYALEPWDTTHLTSYNDAYLAGFRTEVYQLDVKNGFDKAKNIMNDAIRITVMRDIGGDHQKIDSLSTAYNDITFKHILLPIWLSAYRYNNKVYHFMINGRTGEVQGERPYSAIKIILLLLLAIAIVGAALLWKAGSN